MHTRFSILTRCLTAGTAGLALCLFTTPAFAQLGYGLDIAHKSRYVWRGLTYSTASVIQPDFFLTLGKPTSLFTAGIWANADVDPPDRGWDRHRLGEIDLWAEYARAMGSVDVALGVSKYFFHNDYDWADDFPKNLANTQEVYGRLQVWTLPVVDLGLTGWYDFGDVEGAYFEGTLRLQVPFWTQVLLPLGSLILQAQTGFSLGQEVNKNHLDQAYYFEESGITHLDLSLSTTAGYVPLGPFNLALHLEGHLPFKRNTRTKNTPWAGITLTVLGPRCHPERDICP